MEEKSETEQPRRYTWPKYVLGGVVLWIVLVIIWMSVLVRRTREQRDYTPWPQTTPVVPSQTNSVPIHTNALNGH
jgi:flagellar biosynthesis/type III secretory pathway M-ring protein FliF/YscJ